MPFKGTAPRGAPYTSSCLHQVSSWRTIDKLTSQQHQHSQCAAGLTFTVSVLMHLDVRAICSSNEATEAMPGLHTAEVQRPPKPLLIRLPIACQCTLSKRNILHHIVCDGFQQDV